MSASDGAATTGPADDGAVPAPPRPAPVTARPALRRRVEAASELRRRAEHTTLGRGWRRLSGLDLMSRAMEFAALLLVCFLPFMIVVGSLAGRSAAGAFVARFGLDGQARRVLEQVFQAPQATSAQLAGLGWVFLVLGGFTAAGAVQQLYRVAFDLPAARGIRELSRRGAWLGLLLGELALAGWSGPWLRDIGGLPLLAAAALVFFTAFWWVSMWVLVAPHLSWAALFPSALTTGICWLATMLWFRLTMSDTITSNYREYGDIGVVFALMSFLIAVGVVLLLGAVAGSVWREQRRSSRAAGTGRGRAS